MQKVDLELAVTNKCNWNCHYCLVDVHNQPKIEFQSVIDIIDSVPPESEITLSGGEPGLLKRSEIELILKKLKEKNCIVDLLTNGLFLEKYPDLTHNFGEILYHTVEGLEDDFKRYEDPKIIYVLVILNEDIVNGSVEKFLKKHSDIKFLLSPNKLLTSENKIYNNFLNLLRDMSNHIHPRTKPEFLKNMARR